MTEARKIAETIGYREIAAAVGVGTTAVSNAVVRGKFPASWFVAVSQLCATRELECSAEAFGMRLPAMGSLGDSTQTEKFCSPSQSKDTEQTVSERETIGGGNG